MGVVSSIVDVALIIHIYILTSECIVQCKRRLEYESIPMHCIIQIYFVQNIWLAVRAEFFSK